MGKRRRIARVDKIKFHLSLFSKLCVSRIISISLSNLFFIPCWTDRSKFDQIINGKVRIDEEEAILVGARQAGFRQRSRVGIKREVWWMQATKWQRSRTIRVTRFSPAFCTS